MSTARVAERAERRDEWITFFSVFLFGVICFGNHTTAGNISGICVPWTLLWMKGHTIFNKDTLYDSSPNIQDSELASRRIQCISHNDRSFEIRVSANSAYRGEVIYNKNASRHK